MAIAEQSPPNVVVVPKRRERTPLGEALSQLQKNKFAVASFNIIALLTLAAI
jgi:hypothetical protein